MLMSSRKIILLFLPLTLLYACQKWEDSPGENLGLTNRYCNIPEAINYNHNFPGIEDSTVCVYPSYPFVGTYRFQDSVYDEFGNLTSLGSDYTFRIIAKDRYKFDLTDFCAPGSLMFFTADRYYRAYSDSLIGDGRQFFCRESDTLSGQMVYRPSDSSLQIQWSVRSDTAFHNHSGRAYKQ